MGSWAVGRMGGDPMESERGSWAGWGDTLRGLGRDRQAHWCLLGPDMEVIRVLELLQIPALFFILEMRNTGRKFFRASTVSEFFSVSIWRLLFNKI